MEREAEVFVKGLADKFVELSSCYTNHVKDNRGEVLPHLLMADYACKAIEAEVGSPWVVEFLDQLEHSFQETDDAVSNVIAVSFVEHLPLPTEDSPLPLLLGKRMRHQYALVFGLRA